MEKKKKFMIAGAFIAVVLLVAGFALILPALDQPDKKGTSMFGEGNANNQEETDHQNMIREAREGEKAISDVNGTGIKGSDDVSSDEFVIEGNEKMDRSEYVLVVEGITDEVLDQLPTSAKELQQDAENVLYNNDLNYYHKMTYLDTVKDSATGQSIFRFYMDDIEECIMRVVYSEDEKQYYYVINYE